MMKNYRRSRNLVDDYNKILQLKRIYLVVNFILFSKIKHSMLGTLHFQGEKNNEK